MTQSTRVIFEHHQVRKNKKQKAAFAAYVREIATQHGYSYAEEKGSFGANNLIVGDAKHAKVIYTAHYDTCARLPFPNFITPKNFLVYLLYQIVISLLILIPPFLALFGLPTALTLAGMDFAVAFSIGYLMFWVAMIAVFWLILAGPANKHTANDNTSGVTLLLDIMQQTPEELRGQLAFIFFDLEEMGLFGSAGYRSRHKKDTQNTLLINFDCVSDGDHLLFALRKGAKPYADAIKRAFPSTPTLTVEVLSRGVFYPSDQINFPCGVGVAALKQSRIGLLYMDRIHTSRDTVYEQKNMDYLCAGAIRLAQELTDTP